MIKQMLFVTCSFFPIFEANSDKEIIDDIHRIYSEWELDRNSGGVKTFTRWIELEGSDKVRERYTLFNIPRPFEKRDLISNYRVESTGGGEKATILISSREDYIPEKPHVSRLKDYTATWTVVGTTDNKVTISFSVIANTPPMFPRFIQDPILAQMFHNNLVTLKKMPDS